MGILADLDLAKISFHDPQSLQIGFGLSRSNQQVFSYQMHSFEIQFGIRFDPDPAVGVGGAPVAQEDWQIGTIQNVLYARYKFDYEGASAPFFREFMLPTVDITPGSKELPFYSDGISQQGTRINRPVRNIIYTSTGYKAKAPDDNSPSFYNMWDQPGGGAPFILSKDGMDLKLRSFEKVLIFQTWLVAMKIGEFATSSPGLTKIRNIFIPDLLRQFGKSIAPLACIPPFTLTFWADVDLANFRPKFSFELPKVKWGLYGNEGYFPKKPINRSITDVGSSPIVKPVQGDGGRSPVISGAISADNSRAWLRTLGLDV
jgi:hypothetical protein